MKEEYQRLEIEDIDQRMTNRGFELWQFSEFSGKFQRTYLKKFSNNERVELTETGDFTISSIVKLVYTGGLLTEADIKFRHQIDMLNHLETSFFDFFHPKAKEFHDKFLSLCNIINSTKEIWN